MDSWLTDAVKIGLGGALGAVLTAALTFATRWRKQTTDNWQLLFHQGAEERSALSGRVLELERQIETIRAEHVQCLETQATLRAELMVSKDMQQRMHEENKSLLTRILTKMEAK